MKRAAGRLALLAVVVAAAAPLATSAGAVAPSTLGVFAAESIGSPLGIVSRVPAESPGGLVLSGSSVQLGKSQAQAAGATLGPLGDAFLITSVPGGVLTSIPAKVTAQDPPSETSPREASFQQGQEVGPVKGAVLRARASDAPRATGEASGSAFETLVVRAGASTSRSESTVLPDGTVTTTARADVQDVAIGPAGVPPLTFGSVSSVATVTVPLGGKPTTVLSVNVTGAQLAGVPVTVGGNGVTVAGNVAVPPSSISAVNDALRALGERGLTLAAVPAVREETAQGARIRGAALRIRYTAPSGGVPRPSDVGTDEELLLGSVSASATARPRVPLGSISTELPVSQDLPSAATGPTGPSGGALAGPAGGAALGAALQGGTAPPAADAPVPELQAVGPPGFSLPMRTSTAAVEQLLASYRMFLLAALLGVGALLAFRPGRRLA